MKAYLFIIFVFSPYYFLAQNYWIPTSGPPGSEVTCLYKNSAGKIFCGTQDGGIYYSTNYGFNWTNIAGKPNSVACITQVVNGDMFVGSD